MSGTHELNIIRRPAFTVAGLKYRGRNEHEEIPALWGEFWPRHGEISHHVEPGCAYGVVDNFDEETGEFDYVAGVAVTDAAYLPAGMVAVQAPAQTYAVFDCTLPTLRETFGRAIGEWLPAAGYARADGPDFELYDERFDPAHGRLDMSLYIPIQEK